MRSMILSLFVLFAVSGCGASTYENRDTVGTVFPSVEGESLEEKRYQLPEDFAGKPVLFMVGYVQRTQFDLDRWLLGLVQLKTPVTFVEVPTIKGLMPGLFADWIDSAMRKGIPQEDWGGVITVYGDASKIVEWTGNVHPENGRICLLDETGKVIWFHDRGYSAAKVSELDKLVRSLAKKSTD